MIYPAEADIVQFLKSLTQSLQPYAHANELHLSFSSQTKKQLVFYQPFLLSQSITQLVCNMINLLPPKSRISVRWTSGTDGKNFEVEVENTSINLVRAHEVCSQTMYAFTVHPLSNGTLYRLTLPAHHQDAISNVEVQKNTSLYSLPQFYAELQKRLRSHFTQAEKLTASLSQSQPREAAFIQKVNAVIQANLENEKFDTNALGKAMSLSRTQLFRRLKLLIRQAPAHHIKNMRLQRAKELLENTDCTVSEIAFKTGFQSCSHFTKSFRKQYGILPSVFRQKDASATNESKNATNGLTASGFRN